MYTTNKYSKQPGTLIILAIVILLFNVTTDAQQERIFKFASYGKLLLDVDQDDVTAALQVMADAFADAVNRKYDLNYKFENKFYSSLPVLKQAIIEENVDCLSLPIIEYFRLNGDSIIEPYFTGTSGVRAYREFYIIVNKENGYTALSDLKNNELLTPQQNYNSIVDMWLFNEINKFEKINKLGEFFSRVRQIEYESKVILEVFFNKADVGIISRNAYEVAISMNPQLKSKTLIIGEFGRIITGLFALRKTLDENTKELFENSVLSMGDDDRGTQILNLFKIDHLYRINNEMLEGARKVFNEYKLNSKSE